jgi:signal transduction histidine kinase
VVKDLDMLIDQTGGRVEIGDLPTIEADLPQIRQLLGNLIGNALKFRNKDVAPLVKIDSKPIRKRTGVIGAAQCQVIVADNGIGFEEKFAERIFQPFERLHSQGKYEGTGIGLSICKKIVERHGGSIIAQGEPGRGAKFIATLPVSE